MRSIQKLATAVAIIPHCINTIRLVSQCLGGKKIMCEEELEEEESAEFWYGYCQENPDDPVCFELYEDFE